MKYWKWMGRNTNWIESGLETTELQETSIVTIDCNVKFSDTKR